MTLDVYRGRKTTQHKNQDEQDGSKLGWLVGLVLRLFETIFQSKSSRLPERGSQKSNR